MNDARNRFGGDVAPDRPDVLFIAVDDLNDWIGCLGGHPQADTPNLDRLAARGMLFGNAHAPAPACTPSRAAVMSGLRPSTTGIYGIGQAYGPPLRDVVTLNRYFLAAGYEVLGSGKVYHSSGGLPDEHETCWTDYFTGGGDPLPPVASVSGLDRGYFDWGPLDVPDEAMRDHRRVTWAIERLRSREPTRPQFLAVGIGKPHLPWYVPRHYFDRFPIESIELPEVLANDLDDIPRAGLEMVRLADHEAVVANDQWRHAVQGYLATVAFVDAQVGRLLDALDESGRADRTITILWSDHGWHLGEKMHWRKFALWERATRAPLMVSAPGVTQPGSVCTTPVDFLRIYPTLADLTGLPKPPHLEGESLLPLLSRVADFPDGVAVTTHWPGNHAVRDARWRYIRYADGSEELYDHDADPHEWHNLAGDPSLAGVRQRLANELPDHDVAPVEGKSLAPHPEAVERFWSPDRGV